MRTLVIAVVLGLLHSSVALATVGGPVLARVLGFDARTQRAYFALQPFDESGRAASLFFYDLASTTPARPVLVPTGPREGPAAAAAFDARVAELRPALTPLAEEPWLESFVFAREAAVWDSVRDESGKRPRFVTRVYTLSDEDRTHPIRLVTLDPSPRGVRELRRYRLPGTSRWLVIWSCESFAFEGGYEMQFPVLLGDWRGRPDPITPEAYAAPR